MKRQGAPVAALVTAGVAVASGLAIFGATGSIRWGLRIFALLVVLALVLFVRALRPKNGRVLAHTPCAHCGRQILFEHEGEICELCDGGLHARCAAEHRTKAHAR